MFRDVQEKIKKHNKILFDRDSESLKELRYLVTEQSHRTIVRWAFGLADEVHERFIYNYPNENRPQLCIETCRKWAMGEIKMPEAKRAILACHAAAKEMDSMEYAELCHAIGHAGAAVHVETHALGFVFYALTAVVLSQGKKNYEKQVKAEIAHYIERLKYWKKNPLVKNLKWASFISGDSGKNREKLLYK